MATCQDKAPTFHTQRQQYQFLMFIKSLGVLCSETSVIFDWQKDYLINLHHKIINHCEYNTKLASIKKQMRWVLKTDFKWPSLKTKVQSVESINNTALLVNFPLYQSCLPAGGMSGWDIKLHHSQVHKPRHILVTGTTGRVGVTSAGRTWAGWGSGCQLFCTPLAIIICKYLSQRQYIVVVVIVV